MATSKPTPMTDAERQRRHRQKRQRELQALRSVVPATPQERESAAQVQRLAAQLDKATRAAAEHKARADALQAGQGGMQSDLQALREAVRTLLPKLPPAAQQVVRAHLQGCGGAQWLAPPAPPPQAAAAPSILSSQLFF